MNILTKLLLVGLQNWINHIKVDIGTMRAYHVSRYPSIFRDIHNDWLLWKVLHDWVDALFINQLNLVDPKVYQDIWTQMYVDKGFLKGCPYWSFDRRRKKCVNMGRLPSLPSTSVTFYQNLLWLRHWGRHRTLVSDKQCIQFSSSISSSFILSNQKM